MLSWPDRRILDLFRIDVPIVQAPMAGATSPEMVIAVSDAGGLGSLPCALLDRAAVESTLTKIRGATTRSFNVNFFCHTPPTRDGAESLAWRSRLAPYYVESGLDPETPLPLSGRAAFDEGYCELVERFRPDVVSFHFGLPPDALLQRVKATGAKVISSATTVEEARWLEQRGCDAIIAMGLEAGGHRGNFLSHDVSRQVGAFALVPLVVDAVKVPVIAAGGIGDGRGMVAALALGASAVQIGTAYLFCPEAAISSAHRRALRTTPDDGTAVTNVYTGRPARGVVNRLIREVGPMSPLAPRFPLASDAVAPLRNTPSGPTDFAPMWSGQAARLGRDLPAAELTRTLATEAQDLLARLGGASKP